MPLDNILDHDFKRRCIGWEKVFCILPRRCNYTGKYLWLKYAYKGTSMLTGPGDPLFSYRWCESKSYMFLKIKGVI